MRIRRFTENSWEYIEADGSPDGAQSLNGGYLLFSNRRDILLRVAKREIGQFKFSSARITCLPHPLTGEFALSLFYGDGSREKELALRYVKLKDVRFVGWKGESGSIEDFYRKMCVCKEDLIR